MNEHIAREILSWHDQNARSFPWRDQTDPYRIWVSEIMLQQTRAETVVPYYERFIKAYPDVFALAAAKEDAVLKLFEGLGYYARPRNLHAAAKTVAHELKGEFPRDTASLKKLPGIGEYTAGAIASIAYGLPTPAIDGNQVRVLSRLFGIRGISSDKAVHQKLCKAAQSLLTKRPGDMNQALMGMGAKVCLSAKPLCDVCCINVFCAAKAQGIVSELPEKAQKRAKKALPVAVLLIYCRERVYVRRRPVDALLGGMWEFPCFVGARTMDEVRACAQELGINACNFERLDESTHVFTHLIWKMTGYACRVEHEIQGHFVDGAALEALPMATAIKVYRQLAIKRLGEAIK